MCSIIPTRGVYFSKGHFVKDCFDFDVVLVDPETYVSLYDGAIKDRILTVVLYATIGLAFSILYFSCTFVWYLLGVGTDDRNYRKRQVLRYLHNIKHSWKHEQLEPPVERDEDLEDDAIDAINVIDADEPQPIEEESPNSEDSKTESESWMEWAMSLFWKSLGYSYQYLFDMSGVTD